MGDQQNRLPGVARSQSFHRGVNTISKRNQCLATAEVIVQIALAKPLRLASIQCQHLVIVHALHATKMPLAQSRFRLHGDTRNWCQTQCRLHGAREVAAVDGGDLVPLDAARGGFCLCQPGCVQRNVHMALNAPLDIPVGFAVANDAECGRRHWRRAVYNSAQILTARGSLIARTARPFTPD